MQTDTEPAENDSVLKVFHETQEWSQILIEIRNAIHLGPPLAALEHDDVARAYDKYIRNIGERLKQACAALGIDVDKSVEIDGEIINVFDFYLPSMDDFEHSYRSRIIERIEQGRFLSSFAPMSVPHVVPMRGDGILIPWWLEKLLNLFEIDAEDVQDVADTFVEQIGEDLFEKLKATLTRAGHEAAARRLERAKEALDKASELFEEALEKLRKNADEFLEKLVKKLSARMARGAAQKKAAKIVAKILGKFVPFVGWAWLILELLWYAAKNIWKALH
jgi:hypothetical protein